MENKTEQKTLHIFVCDTVGVDKQKQERASNEEIVKKPVFGVFISNVIEMLFSSVGNYANPPTVKYSFINYRNNCVAV